MHSTGMVRSILLCRFHQPARPGLDLWQGCSSAYVAIIRGSWRRLVLSMLQDSANTDILVMLHVAFICCVIRVHATHAL